MNTISQTIKEHRKKLGVSQIEAAKQIGISSKALQNYEQGEEAMTDETRKKISHWLGKELKK